MTSNQDRRRRRRGRSESGQASVELVAILPALVICVLVAGHALAAGWALWAAASAARAGARAQHVGGDGAAVARGALPGSLRDGARVRSEDDVRVEVRAPMLFQSGQLQGQGPRVGAAAQLDPADD
jgi:pilus assembly protein CpaE